MSDQISLLRAIADAPNDDLVRTVYAEYCFDRGMNQRGEFIRLQLEADQAWATGDKTRASSLWAAASKIEHSPLDGGPDDLLTCGAAWSSHFLLMCRLYGVSVDHLRFEFVRGFISDLTTTLPDVAYALVPILGFYPITKLNFYRESSDGLTYSLGGSVYLNQIRLDRYPLTKGIATWSTSFRSVAAAYDWLSSELIAQGRKARAALTPEQSDNQTAIYDHFLRDPDWI